MKKTSIFVLLIIVGMNTSAIASLVSIHQSVTAHAYWPDPPGYIEDTSETYLWQNFSDSVSADNGPYHGASSMSTSLYDAMIQLSASASSQYSEGWGNAEVDIYFDLDNDAEWTWELKATRDNLGGGSSVAQFRARLLSIDEFGGQHTVWDFTWNTGSSYDAAAGPYFLGADSYRLLIQTTAYEDFGEGARWVDVENFEFGLVGEGAYLPEPTTIFMLGIGSLGFLRKRRR
jgi:hypothetical protein